jgi:AraC-like DNA-binding protein
VIHLFDFDVGKTLIEIKVAMDYSPKILKASIATRPYNAILYVVSGKYTYTCDGNTCVADSGQVMYIPASCKSYEYRISSENGEVLHTMQIEFCLTDTETGNKLAFSEVPVKLDVEETHALKNSMKVLISAYTSSSLCARHECISELFRIFSLCSNENMTDIAKKSKKNIAPAVKYIEEHYNTSITSSFLADICNISQSQLRRDFNSVYGVSPMEYKRNILCKMAKRLILAGEFTIGETAEILGFGDIYEFSHFFAKYAGMSPRDYFKKHN